MPISFACTECGQRYQVADTLAGKRIKCQKCAGVLTIPALAAPRPAARPALQAFGQGQPAARPAVQSSGAATAPPPSPAAKPPPPQHQPSSADLYDLEEEPAPPPKPAPSIDGDQDNPYAAPRARPAKTKSKKGRRRGEYAGVWRRYCASFADGLVLNGIGFGIGRAVQASQLGGNLGVQIGVLIGSFVIQILYYAIGHSSERQATFGKRAMGLVVTDLDGRRISFGRAVAREFLKVLLILAICIDVIASFFTILFTEKKQALHDMIVGTVVIRGD
jgi:uncharacterized RDD family membrane protein YckC